MRKDVTEAETEEAEEVHQSVQGTIFYRIC